MKFKNVYHQKSVYRHYAGTLRPQAAYVYLDLRNGECGAECNREKSPVPSEQIFDLKLVFPICASTEQCKISELIERHSADFQSILDDTEIVSAGSDRVGKFGADASKILHRLGYKICANKFLDFGADFPSSKNYFIDWAMIFTQRWVKRQRHLQNRFLI